MALPPCAPSPNTASLTSHALRPRASLILALVTLTGFALRLPLLARFPLREDEAIYGYWALHAWYVDPLFLHVWPDKPPIFLWLLSAAFQLWGHAPETAGAAARFAGILASTLTIPVLAASARHWWGWRAALVTALLAALNPFAISFAPTAFTDPVLVLAGSLALTLSVRDRWFWSGFWLGIALMTKQQGLLFIPLVAGYVLLCRRPRAPASILLIATGVASVVLPILYWDSLRWSVAPSPWDLGATNVGGILLLPPAAAIERLRGWLTLGWYLLASSPLWACYGTVLLVSAFMAVRRRAPANTWRPALVLAVWAGGFLLLHITTSVQIWDRYLLPLVIPLTLLGGWAAAEVGDTCRSWQSKGYEQIRRPAFASLAIAGLLVLAAVPAADAAQGDLPIGGDHGGYAGLDEALAVVDTPGALLFHRELGWHARFALFDSIQTGRVELRYYPSAVYLADSATKSPHKERFVVVPDWGPMQDLQLQLAVRRLQADLVLRTGHFSVYRITEQPTADASWRVCALPSSGLGY